MLISLTAGNYLAPFQAYVDAQPIRSTTLATNPNRWRFMRAFSTVTPGNNDIAPQYTALFGALVGGQAYATRVRRMETQGVISTDLQATNTIAP